MNGNQEQESENIINQIRDRALQQMILNARAGHFTQAWDFYVEYWMIQRHGRYWRLTHPAPTKCDKICMVMAAVFGLFIRVILNLLAETTVTFWESLNTGIFREVGALFFRLILFFVWLTN